MIMKNKFSLHVQSYWIMLRRTLHITASILDMPSKSVLLGICDNELSTTIYMTPSFQIMRAPIFEKLRSYIFTKKHFSENVVSFSVHSL